MTFIPLPIPAELWPLISQGIANLAQSVGGETLRDKVRNLLHHNKLENEVKAAIDKAYHEFETTLPDRDLIATLTRAGQALQQQTDVRQLLAEVATTPMYEDEQMRRLALAFARVAPNVAQERLRVAAQRLVTDMQAQISAIRELQPALMALYNRKLTQAIADQMPLPPYEPRLRKALEAAATRITRELQQGYVTSAHLLYALTTLEHGVAVRVLANYGITEATARQALSAIIQRNENAIADPLTQRAEEIFRDAQRDARTRVATATRSEHVLIALLEKRSPAVLALFQYVNVPADQVYNQVLTSIRVETALQSFTRMGGR